MKIAIEFTNKEYTVTHGKFKGKGPTLEAAIHNMSENFKTEMTRFFAK